MRLRKINAFVFVVGLVLSVTGLYLYSKNYHFTGEGKSAVGEEVEISSAPFDIESRSVAFTKNELKLIVSQPKSEQGSAYFSAFYKNMESIFFDKKIFFAEMELSADDLHWFKLNLQDVDALEGLQSEEQKEEKVALLKKRIAVNDFLLSYADENDSTKEIVIPIFVDLLRSKISDKTSQSTAKAFFGEKIDQIRALAYLDPNLATEELNLLDPKIKEKIIIGYYLGLKDRGVSNEEYAEWVSQVAKKQ